MLRSDGAAQLAKIVHDGFIEEIRSLGADVVIYGSFAYGTQTAKSDLDVLTVGSLTDVRRTAVMDLVTTAQHRLGLPIDNEVPIESKILAGWDDLAEAATGLHFYTGPDRTTPLIKPIEKTAAYLSSRDMCLRLWQNILVGKSVAITAQQALLHQLQRRARRAMVGLHRDVTGADHIAVADTVDWLIGKGDSDTWLGFRDRPEVRRFLTRSIQNAVPQEDSFTDNRKAATWLST